MAYPPRVRRGSQSYLQRCGLRADPRGTSGPYYIANHLIRRGITENQPGVPLALCSSPERALRVRRPLLPSVADVVAELASLAAPAPPPGGI